MQDSRLLGGRPEGRATPGRATLTRAHPPYWVADWEVTALPRWAHNWWVRALTALEHDPSAETSAPVRIIQADNTKCPDRWVCGAIYAKRRSGARSWRMLLRGLNLLIQSL
jgi:hypothetical protein